MTDRGIDTPENCTRRVECLRGSGYRFVARYYNVNDAAKNLTRAEAAALSEGGLEIVAVWENGYPTGPEYFSLEKGLEDGRHAFRYGSEVIGQPAAAPVYFAVDFDASESHINGEIAAYFRGVREAFRVESGGQAHYPVGVYGSGLTCSRLLAEGLVSFTWLAQSMGWAGSSEFNDWNIKQSTGRIVCGLSADLDESGGRGGGFVVSSGGERRGSPACSARPGATHISA